MVQPLSISAPSYVSKEQLIGGAGAAGGIIGAQFASALTTTGLNLIGDGALVGSVAAKAGLGWALYELGTRANGAIKPALWFASIGAVGSIMLDVINRAWPGGAESLALRLVRRPVAVRRAAPTALGYIPIAGVSPAVKVIG